MKRNILFSPLLLAVAAFIFSGCARGEDDPWFTLHSRDARMSQPWKLVEMSGTVVNTDEDNEVTNIEYQFDGTNLFISTDSETESFGFTYTMDVRDNGEVISKEVRTDPANSNNVLINSSKTSYWYWGNDDKNKTSVVLDLTGDILNTYKSYDIPRLAWDDMTLSVSYSDNYQEIVNDTSVVSYTSTVDFQLKFEIDLDALEQ
ncbi:MAG: hypothetical protein ACKVPJ_07410 [Chitinophagales bacterium]